MKSGLILKFTAGWTAQAARAPQAPARSGTAPAQHGQAWPGRRLVLAFQPHRFSRTRDLLDDFGRALSECDALLVTEVYAAGEAPIAGADGRAICRAVRTRGRVEPVFVERVDDLAEALRGVLRDGDVVVTMGAGSIGAVAQELKTRFAAGALGRLVHTDGWQQFAASLVS